MPYRHVLEKSSREALLYESLPDQKVRCGLCAHRCVIPEGSFGICQVRQNQGGKLHTLVYGRAIARHVDPVEKKPLFHFFPGTLAYSVATPGCNFRCPWCQNWEISQMPRQHPDIGGEEVAAEEIVDQARSNVCRSIAYTYTEPTIFFEYARDVARLADAACIQNVMVTNGYMTPAMLEDLHPYLDAANVDLKAFRDATYRKHVGGRLQPILDNMEKTRQLGVWLEVTMLLVPGLNDDPAELRDAARFIAERLGPQTPWHLSRFQPAYQMTTTLPTPLATLKRAQEIGREAGLRYVYLGNVPGDADTRCHGCGSVLIRRSAAGVLNDSVTSEGTCPECGTPVAGVGMGGAA